MRLIDRIEKVTTKNNIGLKESQLYSLLETGNCKYDTVYQNNILVLNEDKTEIWVYKVVFNERKEPTLQKCSTLDISVI